MKFDRQNLLLLALSLTDGQALTPVQIQKSVFLLQEKFPSSLNFLHYDFVPYDYGPFCSDVYFDAYNLQEKGVTKVNQPPDGKVRTYEITAKGYEHCKLMLASIPEQDLIYAKKLVEWVTSQTFQSLVSAVYREFPNYRVNSIFRGS